MDHLGKKILVIDDEPGIREVLSIHLRHAGYDVSQAASAGEALGIAAEGNFDLAICDFTLPDLSGGELIRTLNATSPGLAIIVISGCIDTALSSNLGSCGVIGILNKPFTKATILEKMDQHFSDPGVEFSDA